MGWRVMPAGGPEPRSWKPGGVEGAPSEGHVSDPVDSDCHGVDRALKARETSGWGRAWTSTGLGGNAGEVTEQSG